MLGTIKKRCILIIIVISMLFTAIPAVSFAATEATDLEWWNFRNNEENNGVTDRPAITGSSYAALKWGVKYGTGIDSSVTPPLILDGYLYVASGSKVMKINKATGELIKQNNTDMAGNAGYAMNPMVYADGKIFVQLSSGIIQAIDYETLEPIWHTEAIGGGSQTLCPITYKKIDGTGYLYTGTWTGEAYDGTYYCITTGDENVTNGIKEKVWTFSPSENDSNLSGKEGGKRGFYWAGAYATEKYIAFGSDDGTSGISDLSNGVFYTLNSRTGELIDRVDGIKGDVRSTAVYNDGCLYFTTTGGQLYQVKVDENGNLGEPKTLDLGGKCTASPLVYNGRIYVGICGKGGQFDPDGGHSFAVVDAKKMSLIYTMPISGYPQAAAILSTSEASKDFNGDGEADGRVYIYFTYNANPGGIYYFYDEPGQTEGSGEEGELFVPPANMQEYCISTICMDREGTLYYKNDSGYLMAVEKNLAYLENVNLVSNSGDVSWNRDFDPGSLSYEIKTSSDSSYCELTLSMPEGTTATVNDVSYTGAKHKIDMDPNKDATEVKIVVSHGNQERTYTFNLMKESSVSTLSNICVNNTNSYKDFVAITPSFDSSNFEYVSAQLSQSNSFDNLWLDPTSSEASIKVYGEENVSARGADDEGAIQVTGTNQNHNRYAIYPVDPTLDSKVKIVVTSENGKSISTYYVTFSRQIGVTGISLNKEDVTILSDEETTLQALVMPEDASIKDVLWSSSDDSVATVDSAGKVTGIRGGTAIITATTKDGGFTATCEVTVDGLNYIPVESLKVTLTNNSFTYSGSEIIPSVIVKYKDKTLTEGKDYTLARPSSSKNPGTYYITVNGNHSVYEGSQKVSYTINKADQKISASKSSWSKTYGNKAFSLGAKRTVGDGKLTYKSKNTKVVTVNSSGKVTIKGTGKTTITVTAASTTGYNKATKTITITVAPKKQSLKLTKGNKSFTAKWNKTSTASGYEIMYAKNSKFTKGKKTVKIKSYKTNKKKISKLSKKTTYYVKVRSYKTVGKRKIYGKWSSVKKVKTR